MGGREYTYPEIGEKYEFCKIINGVSNVLYGRLIAVNRSNNTTVFEQLNNGIKDEHTGNYYTGVRAVRGVSSNMPKDTK